MSTSKIMQPSQSYSYDSDCNRASLERCSEEQLLQFYALYAAAFNFFNRNPFVEPLSESEQRRMMDVMSCTAHLIPIGFEIRRRGLTPKL